MHSFACEICNQEHELPPSLAFDTPDFVNKLLPWEREQRCQLSPDWCIADKCLYYVRGCLEMPIAGTDRKFTWGLWVGLSEADFDSTMELWDNPSRSSEPAYEGTIANTLPSYAETRGVSAQIITRGIGERPLIRITDPAHKLFAEQESGMPRERAIELAMMVLHSQSGNPWGYLCNR